MTIIKAKPTTYKGIRFRSKMEAQFAVALDICPNTNFWEYEPIRFSTEWKPDFYTSFYDAYFSQILIEVKPKNVTQDYIEWWYKCAKDLLDKHGNNVTCCVLLIRDFHGPEGDTGMEVCIPKCKMGVFHVLIGVPFNFEKIIKPFWKQSKHYRFDLEA